MKKKLFSIIFLLLSFTVFSQKYVFGKVSSEFGSELGNVIIINTRTDEKIFSDKDGNYMIAANILDELRYAKSGYERNSAKISAENYSQPLNILLSQSPYLIDEITLAFQPTGNLKKDSKTLDPPKKVVALNSSLNMYMRTPASEPSPKLSTPSAFKAPDLSAGQVDLIKLASAALGLFKKATEEPLTTANYAETQQFYRRIKSSLDLSYYTNYGMDEEEIDRFLIYADATQSLAKKYRNNFNISAISSEMKLAFKEYIKTQKWKS